MPRQPALPTSSQGYGDSKSHSRGALLRRGTPFPGQMLDSGSKIKRWQDNAALEANEEEPGVTARLFRVCLDLLSCLTRLPKITRLPTRGCTIIRRCHATLKLWANGHGVWNGKLDDIFERSKNLRHTTLSILNPMCKVLSNWLHDFVLLHSPDPEIERVCADAAQIHMQTKWLLSGLDDSTSDSGSDSEGDAYSDTNSTEEDPPAHPKDKIEHRRRKQLVEDIKTYTECLVDLGSAIECPAVDPEHEDKISVLQVEQRAAHDYHAHLVLAKYPKADPDLVECLGKTSWSRYQRMQQEREHNVMIQNRPDEQHTVHSTLKSIATNSEFQDSGLGTSLPPQSSCAETVISFMTNMTRGERVGIPHLPTKAKNGASFECIACGKHIQASNNRDWRKHLFLDLQPYTCIYVDCAFSAIPFADRQLWSNHLELDHNFGPEWEKVQCPLCMEPTKDGKSAILIHFARHMEDIALAALPREVESDAGSDVVTENELENDEHSNSDTAKETEPYDSQIPERPPIYQENIDFPAESAETSKRTSIFSQQSTHPNLNFPPHVSYTAYSAPDAAVENPHSPTRATIPSKPSPTTNPEMQYLAPSLSPHSMAYNSRPLAPNEPELSAQVSGLDINILWADPLNESASTDIPSGPGPSYSRIPLEPFIEDTWGYSLQPPMYAAPTMAYPWASNEMGSATSNLAYTSVPYPSTRPLDSTQIDHFAGSGDVLDFSEQSYGMDKKTCTSSIKPSQIHEDSGLYQSQHDVDASPIPFDYTDLPAHIFPPPQARTSSNSNQNRSSQHPEIKIKSTDGSSKSAYVITKIPYVRPQHPIIMCQLCNERPGGFRSINELERHIENAHLPVRKGYVCMDASPNKDFLANCKHCQNSKVYGAYYNAAAHLRRVHFNPRKRGRKGKHEEKRGGIGGGDDPPIEVLRQFWIKEVEVVNERASAGVKTTAQTQQEHQNTL